MDNLDKILEGLLFLSGDALDRGVIMEKLQITPKELDKAIDVLKKRYDENCGINFITYKDKLQFCGNQKFADDVSLVLNPIRERQLTRSALEVMAIVAYKQPVTRLDVQEIRGINSDYALQTLINYKLIEVVGRKDAVGKPLLFGTTDEFLRHFGINDINDLPDYDDLMKSVQQIELENNHLYNEFEIPSENQKDDLAQTDTSQQNDNGGNKEQTLDKSLDNIEAEKDVGKTVSVQINKNAVVDKAAESNSIDSANADLSSKSINKNSYVEPQKKEKNSDTSIDSNADGDDKNSKMNGIDYSLLEDNPDIDN